MARPRKIKTPKQFELEWEKYKEYCDNRETICHEFSSKNSEFVTAKLKKSVSYTIEGFCIFLGLARSAFYDTYEKKRGYSDIVTRIREECEVDAREKFELGILPTQLAGLWMSTYGYTTKEKIDAVVDTPVIISGADSLED